MEKGKISLYCRYLEVTTQAFNKYIKNRNKPRKYYQIEQMILQILKIDECNDKYGKIRMTEALKQEFPNKKIPSESVIYRIMQNMGIKHRPVKGPKGITKANKNAKKSEDLLKRDFYSNEPYRKLITDITEIKVKNKKLYVSAIFDCFSLKVLGIAIREYMTAELVIEALRNAYIKYPQIRGAIIHSDRGSQYTSKEYRDLLNVYGITQSMNSSSGRCHDNARCEAMWGRMKVELLYKRYKTKNMDFEIVKELIWRYFMSYWNNRRICSAIGNMTPTMKELIYYNKAIHIA